MTATGFTFSETMAGPFAMGETEPQRGATADSRLTMHATIDIDDLDRFVADPSHTGRLSGRVEFPPLGGEVRAETGVFNLFSPVNEPGMKVMVYELALPGYYLAGKKHVHDNAGFDLWADTTTLFTLLHRGGDARGEIVGAGILTLGVAELAKMVSTMRALGDVNDTPRALLTFGRFFMGELWDTYSRLAQS